MNNEVIQFMERSENSWRSQFMTIVNSAVATAAQLQRAAVAIGKLSVIYDVKKSYNIFYP